MHPKLVSQASFCLDTHDWHDELERECVEDDHDHKSSTTADVRHLLKLLDQAPWLRVNTRSTLQHIHQLKQIYHLFGQRLRKGEIPDGVFSQKKE